MACTHLRKLYELCQQQQLYFSGSDLVRIVCKECASEEVCPTSLTVESLEEADSDPQASDSQAPDSQNSGR
jgi:hypothetical protein